MLEKLNSKKIAIDIDDVLSSTIPNLLIYLKEFHNIHIEYEDFLNYKIHETDIFISKKIGKDATHDIWNEFSMSDYGKNMESVSGSSEVLLKLKELGFEIYLITARWESLRNITSEWLGMRYPEIEFSGLYFTGVYHGHGIKKSQICKELGIEIMIEDNADNVIDLAENDIKSYLISRPWNKYINIGHPNIKRITCWNEII